eukprot:TRINITY_DN14051_c0_g1_i1.p1 TRINITY_DN14051_c0_g1~~TRINITY_DN14051_c0_g1_i1.p1  ORF type:complete len:355 (-),score=75.62 TRINITY_DN14051_c0_g1_i1:208-1242(-)
MADMQNTRVLFAEDPEDTLVRSSNLKVVAELFAIPDPVEAAVLVVKNLLLSLDPYQRGRMNTKAKRYMAAFEVGDVITTYGVSEVIAGQRQGPGIKPGDKILGFCGLEKYSIVPPFAAVQKITEPLEFPIAYYVGILGLTGKTAYYGLSICDLQPGQTIFISAAAGAVGLCAGQIAKIKGLKVIGSAGSDGKVKLLTEQFGFDAAFNYKTAGDLQAKLSELAPEGLDVYFDNVGAEHLDAALANMKRGGTIVSCGMIAQYNGQTYTFKNISYIIMKELRMQGFIISSHARNPEFVSKFMADMTAWLKEGKLKSAEHIVEGLEKAPEAFVGLFSGINTGKLLIKV